jgi:hypothetical protein
MLLQLTTLKNRLGIPEADIQYDALLTNAIKAVSAYFDRHTRRTLAHTVDAQEEFPADDTEIRVACYPIETISRFEIKSDETTGWEEVAEAKLLVRRQCVLSLESPLGGPHQQGRVTYTGGYVLPGETPQPGQSLLPDDIHHAACEQAASWFLHRDKVGLVRSWPSGGTYQQFTELPLLPFVREVLQRHERMLL